MSEQDFELYLTLLAKTLRLSDKQRRAIANELRDHLEARLDELTAEGHDRHTAIQTALAEFGDASALANDFSHIAKQRSRRHIMQTTFGTFAACAAVTFAAMTLAPSNFFSGQPTQPQAGAQEAPARGEQAVQDPPAAERSIFDALPEYSIHVIDCTNILVPRDDGLDLLDRTASLARAIETTVTSLPRFTDKDITVQAFEEFLIVTATDEAYDQAAMLLDQIGARVEEREAIRRAEAEARQEENAIRLQDQAREMQAETDAMLTGLTEMELLRARLREEGHGEQHLEIVRLRQEMELMRNRINQLTARRIEIEHELDRAGAASRPEPIGGGRRPGMEEPRR